MKPVTGERRARARPKRNKLVYKNRWLLSQHLVIALRRAGVVCDIVVQDHPETSSPADRGSIAPQKPGFAPRRSRIQAHPTLTEADPDATPAPVPIQIAPLRIEFGEHR